MHSIPQATSPNETRLRIEGSLDALSAETHRARFDAVVTARRARVSLDLSALRSLDSTGVRLLVALYRGVHAAGGELRVHGVSGQPLTLLRLLRVDQLLVGPWSSPNALTRSIVANDTGRWPAASRAAA